MLVRAASSALAVASISPVGAPYLISSASLVISDVQIREAIMHHAREIPGT